MKFLPYIILSSILALLVLSVIYVSKKTIFVFGIENTRLVYLGVSLFTIIFLFGFGLFMNAKGELGHTIYRISALTIGVYLFMVFSFLIADGIYLFVKLPPSTFGFIGFGLTLIISVLSYWNASNIRITPINIPMQGLNQEVKAVHLTDIHIGHFRTNGFLQNLIDKTNTQNPDVIFLTGDYLDSKYALNKKYFEPLKQLKAPIYFVDGNHDHATDNDSIVALMRSVDVKVLENEVAHLNGLQIVGLNYMLADRNSLDMHASGDNPTIDETLPRLDIDREKATVLLHHAPNGIKYANKYGIDLYLAGHTHAGQIFPFNFFADMMFEYNRGLHNFKGTNVYVSEGVGTFGPPFRIGTKSEIISLTLSPN